MAGSGDPVGQVLATRAGGDHLRALDLASTAVAQLDGAALVSVLIELGELLDVFGEWAEAESILSRAVALAESLQGDDAGELLVRALAALAYAQGVQCHYAETAATLQRARAFAIAGVTASQVFVHSAALEVVRGRFTEALAWIERAESIAQSATIGTERDKALVAVLSARANVERALGQFEHADQLFRRAADATERLFGSSSIELARALNELGVNCKYWGRFDEGEQLYKRAMEIALAAIGAERNPLLTSLHHNLGGLEHARGNYAAAEPHARLAVELRRATAPEHLSLALDEGALAAVLEGLGQHEEAELLLRSALARLEVAPALHRHELAVTLNNLAAIRYRLGDLDEAALLYRRALATKRDLAPDTPELAVSLNNLALVLVKQGCTEEALAMYEEALTLFRNGLQPTHPSIAKCARNYAKLLREAGRADQAAALEAELA